LNYPDADSMEESFLERIKDRPIDLVVCSDAEAILGIGDQGVGGIGVSLFPLFLYGITNLDLRRFLPQRR
jgi:malate dehydrogenase (oxaloacetate-decarboxylating)